MLSHGAVFQGVQSHVFKGLLPGQDACIAFFNTCKNVGSSASKLRMSAKAVERVTPA